ncbi:MAG: orotidine-5'-phosphate decarboxylase [bacterium]|jgi:orotidine-5'-phosphate decarboxylase|nr:orotidine-5'-phosphate decarboxylase [bacterium]
MTFTEKLDGAVSRNSSFVCVGLDPDPDLIPDLHKGSPDPIAAFVKEIVWATKDIACAYKPNFAFYGSRGIAGWQALQSIIGAIPDDIPILLDFKAGDIGNTASHYAKMAYEQLGADGITVNPLMGTDAIAPFLTYPDGCAFLLCLTSNPGSSDILRLKTEEGPVFEILARKSVAWNELGPCGLVVGATHPEDLRRVRAIAKELPILLPGVGSQGGDATAVVKNGLDARGGGILVNASRSILYASKGDDFADAARHAAESLRTQLNHARP